MNNISISNLNAAALSLNTQDTTWILTSACLVFLMIPGFGIYFGGLIQRKNHLTMLTTSLLALSLISIQWYLFGFSISFSETSSSGMIGNLYNFAFINIGTAPHKAALNIPANLFALFQGLLAALTPCIAFGSVIGRTPLYIYIIFLFFWSTLVYDVVAYWIWSPNGWLKVLGALDYAGGAAVHLTAGFSSLAYAILVGPRQLIDFRNTKPTNNYEVFLGTILIWFGWFGLNGSKEYGIDSRAINAIINTNLAACSGGLSWMLTDMFRNRNKLVSISGFCSGALAGLVAISSASGYISPIFSLLLGLITGILCNIACDIKQIEWFNLDDVCNVFAIHGIGGTIGLLLTGIFADNSIVTMSGDEALLGGAGLINSNVVRVFYQLASVLVVSLWSFAITFIILLILRLIPFLNMRYSMVKEEIGSDLVELGASSYGHDLLSLEDESIKQLREQQTLQEQFVGMDPNQYLTKAKYGSMPNNSKNNHNSNHNINIRPHIIQSTVIYDDEPAIEIIEEIDPSNDDLPTLIIPNFHHLHHHHHNPHQQSQSVSQQQPTHQVEYFIPTNCYYQSSYPNHFNYYY